MRIVICDDEAISISAVQGMIDIWRARNGTEAISMAVYTSSEELPGALGNAVPFVLAFVDIQFPRELSEEYPEYLVERMVPVARAILQADRNAPVEAGGWKTFSAGLEGALEDS